jgi:hypothetical protein
MKDSSNLLFFGRELFEIFQAKRDYESENLLEFGGQLSENCSSYGPVRMIRAATLFTSIRQKEKTAKEAISKAEKLKLAQSLAGCSKLWMFLYKYEAAKQYLQHDAKYVDKAFAKQLATHLEDYFKKEVLPLLWMQGALTPKKQAFVSSKEALEMIQEIKTKAEKL